MGLSMPVLVVPRWKVELPQSEAGDDVFGGCRGVEESYERLDQIGEGTYGQVSRGAAALLIWERLTVAHQGHLSRW